MLRIHRQSMAPNFPRMFTTPGWFAPSPPLPPTQLGLQNPRIREMLQVLPAQEVKKLLAKFTAPPDLPAGGGPLYSDSSSLPPEIVAKVAATPSADVLVIMGAQLSARKR